MKVYDQRNRYFTTYKKLYKQNYEPFRDIQVQQIMIFLIMKEFNMFKYYANGIIIDHFPIHHFKTRKKIVKYWKKYFYELFFGMLRPGYNPRALTPITKIAQYCGIQHGFYMGFLVNYTSWLIPMSIIGLICYIYGYFAPPGHDNETVPFISIICAVWVTLYSESWVRMQGTLAYQFDMVGVQENEKQRYEYTGTYVVDSLTKDVVKFDKFTTFQRRLVVRIFSS